MREIKFRGWNPRTKEMYYQVSVGSKPINDLDEFFKETAKDGFVWLQYTGLHDKNGKEIYEGDIVKCFDNTKPFGIGIVTYGEFESSHEGGFSRYHYHIGFYLKGIDGEQMWNNSEEDIEWDGTEVIGNIYENPELI